MNSENMKYFGLLGILMIVISCCSAVPKYEGNAKGTSNSNQNKQYDRAYKENDTYAATTSDRVERLGYTSGYGSVNSYPHSIGPYGPMKLDIGAVILGVILGAGAFLVIPKLVGNLNGGYGYGGNYRSVDGDSQFSFTDMLAKLDDALAKNSIDSTNCMQRVVCTYVRQSTYHHKMGTLDRIDELINTFSENALVDYMVNGTAIKQAIDHGKNLDGDNCDQLYAGCPLDKQQSLKLLSKLLPEAV